MKTTIIAIENDADLAEAQAFASSLMDTDVPAERLTLRAQVQLIKAYESKRWPMEPASAANVIQYIMEQHDLTPADMAPILGTRSRVSEVLNGRRALSTSMIRRLRSRFHVSADVFITDPDQPSIGLPTENKPEALVYDLHKSEAYIASEESSAYASTPNEGNNSVDNNPSI